jgi:hypothetical protein
MPAKGKTRITEAQRVKIAAGKATGKRAEEIAVETGLALQTVYNQANDPRTVTLILRLKHESTPQLERIWRKGLNGLERDIASKNPDIRRHARGQFFRVLPLGDPPLLRIAPADNSGGDFTLEELLISYRKVSVSR